MTHRERCVHASAIVAFAFMLGACGGEEEEAAATESNRTPTITGTPATSANQDTAYSFTPSATDPDGDALLFGIDARPAWATFDTATGRLSGTPTAAHVGTHRGIVVHVSDGTTQAVLPAFDITVVATPTPNRPPTITGTPAASVMVGALYSFTPTASDADGDALTFSIVNRPSWATFDTATGLLRGTPSAAGTFAAIAISVTDGRSAAVALASFGITVTPPPPGNQAPVISGSPSTAATTGVAYAFQPMASDPDGNTLTFAIANRPAWATFNSGTGRLAGTPSAAGTFSNIMISVSDGTASAALPAFAITVTAANAPPVISGTPPTTATVGTAYAFTPTASDPNGQTLTFTITNAPAWAAFDTGTGRLSGTPAAQHVGTTSGIVITASDGTLTASLPAFAVTVQAMAIGSATLSWLPPTQNTDGSPLTNLAGYRIYWGTQQGTYANSVTLNNPGLATYVVEGLASGTHFFVATAVNTAGVESSFSGEASKTIP